MIAAPLLAWLVQSQATASPSPIPSATASAPAVEPVLTRRAGGAIAIPDGWRDKPVKSSPPLKSLGDWNQSGDTGERITLDVMPRLGADLRNVADFFKLPSDVATQVTSTPFSLCNGMHGWKQTYNDSAGGGITIVLAPTRARVYIATYSYPAYAGATAEGKAGVESLCPPPDPATNRARIPISSAPNGWDVEDVTYFWAPAGDRNYAAWIWYSPGAPPGSEQVSVWQFPIGHNRGLSFAITTFLARELDAPPTGIKRSAVILCGGLDGVAIEMQGVREKKPVVVRGIVTVKNRVAYAAIYTRETSRPELPDATRAVRSLCP